MKLLLSLLLVIANTTHTVAKEINKNNASPLSAYSSEWNNPKYKVCNTAAKTKYLSPKEKEIIYVLNLARMNPKLLCKTVVAQANRVISVDTSSEVYYKSLVKRMSQMEPIGILTPDSVCHQSALCHATSTGITGFVGHDRQTEECKKKQRYRGECCMYGISTPLGIILSLLIDEDVKSLGHRNICLGAYKKMSPSFGSYKAYGSITVLDFM